MSTKTQTFGTGRRESHDSSGYYSRHLITVEEDLGSVGVEPPAVILDQIYNLSSAAMCEIPDNRVALMVTSPPYHVGKDYDGNQTFDEYLGLLKSVWAETYRVLAPGGRAVVNVAGIGRKPYIGLQHIVHDQMLDLGFLPRGEVIWVKGAGSNGSCAWGSFGRASNPVLRDLHEYCLVYSKDRYGKGFNGPNSISNEDFMAATLSVWNIPPASATRIGHPAPFPIELPKRFIELYTYEGELVLDPFLGSGTTAIAAKLVGRHYVGYDTSQEYVDLARERIDSYDYNKNSKEIPGQRSIDEQLLEIQSPPVVY